MSGAMLIKAVYKNLRMQGDRSHWQIFDWEYCCPKRCFDRPHVHAQIPSHRSPSVERFRIHVEGVVRSTGWLDGFPEVGRRGSSWRRGWTKGLLDASTEG